MDVCDLAEDEDALSRCQQDKERMEEVGRIDVQFWRCEGGPQIERGGISAGIAGLTLNEAGPVHEKALKGEAKYHCVL